MLLSEIPIIFPFIVFFIFVVFCFFRLGVYLWNLDYKKRRELTGYHLRENKSLSDIVDAVSPPFTLEIVTHYLDKSISQYIYAPASADARLEAIGAKEVSEYSVCGTKDNHFGTYLSSSKENIKISDIDINSIDFSNINEVGESAVVQFVIKKGKDNSLLMNIRTLIVAPSSFQGKEILSSIKKSISGFRSIEKKDDEFIANVCARSFIDNETITILV